VSTLHGREGGGLALLRGARLGRARRLERILERPRRSLHGARGSCARRGAGGTAPAFAFERVAFERGLDLALFEREPRGRELLRQARLHRLDCLGSARVRARRRTGRAAPRARLLCHRGRGALRLSELDA